MRKNSNESSCCCETSVASFSSSINFSISLFFLFLSFSLFSSFFLLLRLLLLNSTSLCLRGVESILGERKKERKKERKRKIINLHFAKNKQNSSSFVFADRKVTFLAESVFIYQSSKLGTARK